MSDNLADRAGPDRSAAAGLLCPACRVDLVMSERQGIEIDYCPRCRGVWLDRGELDKILERSAADLAPSPGPPPEYRRERDEDYRRDEYKHSKHRRRSFLDELFD
jgi:Zn-finger nucleic acid-binding protein